MVVREMSRWMSRIDERILEQLDDANDSMSAWELAYDIDEATRGRVRERCHVLAHAGFAEVLPREPNCEQYVITGWGQQYLVGEVNADLRRPLPAPRPPESVRPGRYVGFG